MKALELRCSSPGYFSSALWAFRCGEGKQTHLIDVSGRRMRGVLGVSMASKVRMLPGLGCQACSTLYTKTNPEQPQWSMVQDGVWGPSVVWLWVLGFWV